MSALAQPQPADPPAPPPRVPRPRRAPAVRSTLHTARMGVTLAGGPHAEFKARAAVDYRLAVRFPLAATAEQVLKRFGQLVSVPYPAHYYSELWFADAALAPDVRLVDLLDLPYGGVLEVRERRHEIKVGELPQRKHYVADVHPAAHRLQRARDEASSNRSTRFVDEMRRLRKEAQEVAPGHLSVCVVFLGGFFLCVCFEMIEHFPFIQKMQKMDGFVQRGVAFISSTTASGGLCV